jgi:POT family proton-dependent oligopeptide transporter
MNQLATASAPQQRTFLGHPIGLYVLFFTEMWERFSYYGMRALLILYMVNYFKWSQGEASNIYKIYTSFVYITPIIGGFLADRYLGNRLAVLIGAVLMAIGHFLMAFETLHIFYAALVFLIIGNGFFKPNMSTQVGRLYPTGDGRRDAAYTIFYMGINLGAFLAPLVCGWLQENTVGEYHSGFTMAGIGMVCGLLIYLLGQPLIREIKPGSAEDHPVVAKKEVAASAALTEPEAEKTRSVLGALADLAPKVLIAGSLVLLLAAPGLFLANILSWFDAGMVGIAGVCGLIVGWVGGRVRGGMRDRVLAILVLGVFVVFFWAAFEQAGNVLNLWADKATDRNVTRPMTPPNVYPEEEADSDPQRFDNLWERFRNMFQLKKKQDKSWEETVNPMPTTWFQAINAAAIVLFAPLFTFLWMALDRRGRQPSIPVKMTLGLLFMSASIGVMVFSAQRENRPTAVPLKRDALPQGVGVDEAGKLCAVVKPEGSSHTRLVPFFAGRLSYEASTHTLNLSGVLPDTERDRIVRATAPESFTKEMEELKKRSDEQIRGRKGKSASVTLSNEPPGFDLRCTGFPPSKVEYDPATRTLTTYRTLGDKDVKALLVAAGDPRWRDTINELYVNSSRHRVSLWWLFWSYILATFGELCLSPVGLSMVSKLSPAKFATLLMGMWLLTSSFGNFAAGLFGELAEWVPPLDLFLILTAVTGVAAVVLYVVSRKVVSLMHGVN